MPRSPAKEAARIIVDTVEADRYSAPVGPDTRFMDFIYRQIKSPLPA